MAKKSMLQREIRRTKLVKKYAARRAELKAKLKERDIGYEERLALQIKLQKMPRDTSRVRQQRRCSLTGRPHGVYRKFGLGRNKLREATMRGDVPGLRKGSW